MSTDPHRSDRVVRRAGSRIAVGFVIGPLIGGLVGLAIGWIVFDLGTRGLWAAAIAGAVFGALGGFWAGMSAFGPPAPEDDPLPREDDLRAEERPGHDHIDDAR